MEIITNKGQLELVFIRLDPGEKVLENIKKVIKERNIKSGVIVSGIGGLSVCRIHSMIAGDPPNLLRRYKKYYEIMGPIELSSMQGIIADQRPHLHVTVSNGKEILIGHMEESCIVFSFAEIVILKTDEDNIIRRMNYPEKIEQLTNFK